MLQLTAGGCSPPASEGLGHRWGRQWCGSPSTMPETLCHAVPPAGVSRRVSVKPVSIFLKQKLGLEDGFEQGPGWGHNCNLEAAHCTGLEVGMHTDGQTDRQEYIQTDGQRHTRTETEAHTHTQTHTHT